MDRRTDNINPPPRVNGEQFRMSFWRWFLLSAIVAQLLLFLFTILTTLFLARRSAFDNFAIYLSEALAVNVLLIPGLLLYVHIWAVRVTPTTLAGFDAWGTFVTVQWDTITAVKPVSLPFLPTLRVYSSETQRVLWLPLFLVDYPKFAQRVAEYAGPQHPLTQAVLARLDQEESP